MSSKCFGCLRNICCAFARCSVGTNDASCSSFDCARWWNATTCFPVVKCCFIIPKMFFILTFSGMWFVFGSTSSDIFFACIVFISFFILLLSVFIAFSSAPMSSCSVTFLFLAIGVLGTSSGSSFSSSSILSISYVFSSVLPYSIASSSGMKLFTSISDFSLSSSEHASSTFDGTWKSDSSSWCIASRYFSASSPMSMFHGSSCSVFMRS